MKLWAMWVYLLLYLTSFLFAKGGHDYLAGFCLLFAAIYLYGYDLKESGSFIHLRGLFSLSWVGGQGLSCLKLSWLQVPWSNETWICFLLALTGFWLMYEAFERRMGAGYKRIKETSLRNSSCNVDDRKKQKPVFWSIVSVTLVSFGAFCFEAWYLGFIPFFMRGVPHAYSAFHVSGVHYFTVSCVLVPALAVIYFGFRQKKDKIEQTDKWRTVLTLCMTGLTLMIPILCVSRFQLIFAVALAVLTYLGMKQSLKLRYAVGLAAVMIPCYILLTIARSHGVGYLNSIFEMKYDQMPIFITQPYIYIAHNYDNFNCLVEGIQEHSMGLKSLFPLFALTGLKFYYPQLVHFPLLITKTELTTLTLFYDSYYDFGILGVLGFSCILGAAAYLLTRQLTRFRNPIGYLFYGQIALYLLLSFFTTWFSNPTTWFYLVVTGMLYIYFEFYDSRKRNI